MNNQVIPQGPTETVTDGTVTEAKGPILSLFAETDLVITNLEYQFPAGGRAGTALTGFTLKAGRYLFYVKALAFTGTATLIYQR